jgi:uncharacterized lipoprotein YmbA
VKGAARCAWILAIATLLGAGCSIVPAPQPDSTRYFILNAVAPAGGDQGAMASSAEPKLAIGLGPINFPDYLARSEIVTRGTGDEVEVSSNDRWAESLDITFKRILSHDLSMVLGGAQIVDFPWFGPPTHLDYRVEPAIDRFEADAQNAARLTARWRIIQGTGGQVLYTSSSDISVPAASGNYAAMAAALSQAASEFAGEIASAIRRLSAPAE